MGQRQRRLGKSELTIAPIGLGLWAVGGDMWGRTEDARALDAIDAALDAGINFFDTADVYGWGHSEELLGEAMRGRRDRFVVATKIGWWGFDGERGQTAYDSVDKVVTAVTTCLTRLQTDFIDVIFSHIGYQDPTMPVLVAGFQKLQRDGKIRAYGVSTSDFDYLQAFNADEGCAVVQVDYSLLNRTPEADIFPYCQQHDIGIVTRGSLAMGRLTGKFTPETTFPEGDFRQSWVEKPEERAIFLADLERAARLQGVAGERPLSQFALQFAISHPAVTAAIPGAKTAGQMEQNAAPLHLPTLSPSELAQINDIVPPGGGRKIWPA